MKRWNVLLPGPSLSKLTERPEGEVVSVNAAIRHPIVPDFFCALDSPLSLGQEADRRDRPIYSFLEHQRPRIWTDPLNFEAWRKAGFPNLEGWDWRNHGIPWLPKLLHKTVFYAILGCLMHGAKRIDLWGCDMRGEEYFDGPGDRWGDARWAQEGPRMEKVVEAALAQGIQIGRR